MWYMECLIANLGISSKIVVISLGYLVPILRAMSNQITRQDIEVCRQDHCGGLITKMWKYLVQENYMNLTEREKKKKSMKPIHFLSQWFCYSQKQWPFHPPQSHNWEKKFKESKMEQKVDFRRDNHQNFYNKTTRGTFSNLRYCVYKDFSYILLLLSTKDELIKW